MKYWTAYKSDEWQFWVHFWVTWWYIIDYLVNIEIPVWAITCYPNLTFTVHSHLGRGFASEVIIFWLGFYRKSFISLQVVELCHRRIYKAFRFWKFPFVNGDIVESKCGWFSGWWFISIEKDESISKPVWHIKDFILQISIRAFGGDHSSLLVNDCILKV